MKFRTYDLNGRMMEHTDHFGDKLTITVEGGCIYFEIARPDAAVMLTEKEFNKLVRKTNKEIDKQEEEQDAE
jgi:hypothetical protein